MLCHWCSTLLFFGVRRYEEYLSTPNFWGLFFKKSSVPCFITNIICIFAVAFCLIWLWCPLSRTEPLGGALHVRRRYWRFVFGYSNFHNRLENKNNADVIPRGVYIRLRSVLRGSCILISTLYGHLYTLRWCLLCLFSLWLWKARISNRQM